MELSKNTVDAIETASTKEQLLTSFSLVRIKIEQRKTIIKIVKIQRHRALGAHPGARRGLREGGPGLRGDQEGRPERRRRGAELGRVRLVEGERRASKREDERAAARKTKKTDLSHFQNLTSDIHQHQHQQQQRRRRPR